MKSREEIMEILEAFDLTGSFRGAGELAGCSHHTVAHWVARRVAGELPAEGPTRRERMIDPFLAKVEEWVEGSDAKIRADVAFDKLKALGFDGSERTVRRAVAGVKANQPRGGSKTLPPTFAEARRGRTVAAIHASRGATTSTIHVARPRRSTSPQHRRGQSAATAACFSDRIPSTAPSARNSTNPGPLAAVRRALVAATRTTSRCAPPTSPPGQRHRLSTATSVPTMMAS